ncbi:hypothetical protein F4802DRAFT_561140 [Xylaria palmicola]|nr:hypothetical protein F4802DRAFT_561140 [Xylaria palmicola]
MYMDELTNLDYRGIGEGLLIGLCRDSSPSEPAIIPEGEWQTLSSHQGTVCDPHLGTSTASAAEHAQRPELETKQYESSSTLCIHVAQLVASADEKYPQQHDLTSLERYRYHVHRYEQIPLGLIPTIRRLSNPDPSLVAVATLIGELGRASAPSSVISSASSNDTNKTTAMELDDLLLMKDSPEWQVVPYDEQSKHLRRIAKLKRRLKAEGNPRKINSARARKRTKQTYGSNEPIRD